MSFRVSEAEAFYKVCGQYFAVGVGVITLITLGLSIHHDNKWNNYVDLRFNMNLGMKLNKFDARDYMDVTSQQEWIDLITRARTMETLAIGIILITTGVKCVHIATAPDPTEAITRHSVFAGGFIFVVGAFLEGAAAVLIITSIVAANDDANHVMELIHNPRTNWPDFNSGNVSEATFEADLYMNVYCDTSVNKWAAPLQCQLAYAKVLATVFCFLNALNSLTLSFTLLCTDFNKIKPITPTVPAHRMFGSFGPIGGSRRNPHPTFDISRPDTGISEPEPVHVPDIHTLKLQIINKSEKRSRSRSRSHSRSRNHDENDN